MKSTCCLEPTIVIDSRDIEDGLYVRRRRECTKCKERESTKEVPWDYKSESSRVDTKALKKLRDMIDEELNRVERLNDEDEDFTAR